jgi:hypothetical protein
LIGWEVQKVDAHQWQVSQLVPSSPVPLNSSPNNNLPNCGGVAVGGFGILVLVGVAVAGTGVFVRVAVAGTGVFVSANGTGGDDNSTDCSAICAPWVLDICLVKGFEIAEIGVVKNNPLNASMTIDKLTSLFKVPPSVSRIRLDR